VVRPRWPSSKSLATGALRQIILPSCGSKGIRLDQSIGRPRPIGFWVPYAPFRTIWTRPIPKEHAVLSRRHGRDEQASSPWSGKVVEAPVRCPAGLPRAFRGVLAPSMRPDGSAGTQIDRARRPGRPWREPRKRRWGSSKLAVTAGPQNSRAGFLPGRRSRRGSHVRSLLGSSPFSATRHHPPLESDGAGQPGHRGGRGRSPANQANHGDDAVQLDFPRLTVARCPCLKIGFPPLTKTNLSQFL